jgi:hypothetical protein
LDFFQARYFGAALGRFTSPDPENAGADFTNPQSWNAYAYVLGNPLANVDPTGTEDCPAGADFCVTHSEPPDPWSPGGSLFQLWWDSTFQRAQQVAQQVQQAAQQAMNWVGAPRDPNCMTAHTMGVAGTGMAGGALVGSFFGPGDVATVPLAAATGYVGGAALGRIGGLISCMSSTGTGGDSGGGGGRASGSEARLTKPQQRQTAKYLGMKEVKGLTSQGQPVFEKGGRYFSFSNTSHTAGEVFKELDRSGNRIATTDLNLNRIAP